MENQHKVGIKIDTSEIDETKLKIRELNRLIEKANSLVNELANKGIKIKVEIKN